MDIPSHPLYNKHSGVLCWQRRCPLYHQAQSHPLWFLTHLCRRRTSRSRWRPAPSAANGPSSHQNGPTLPAPVGATSTPTTTTSLAPPPPSDPLTSVGLEVCSTLPALVGATSTPTTTTSLVHPLQRDHSTSVGLEVCSTVLVLGLRQPKLPQQLWSLFCQATIWLQ